MNYYNEFDPKAAAWLQQLIDNKQIPYGYVDSRSILEVQPSDLRGFVQAHFFAGIGGWSLALRLAGWPEDRPVWTASLPCQPFSSAGKQLGTDDERHLAPTFLELVRQCRPARCFGEQVASKLARTDWLPGIRVEFETLGYSFGAADLCAPCAGEIGEGRIVRGDQESWERVIIGHPHIRQRLYWVADRRVADSRLQRRELCAGDTRVCGAHNESGETAEQPCVKVPSGGLAHSRDDRTRSLAGKTSGCGGGTVDAGAEGLRQAHGEGGTDRTDSRSAGGIDGIPDPVCGGPEVAVQSEQASRGTIGIWQTDVPRNSSTPQLLPCRDGKTRRTQSGIFPLVDGLPRGVVPSGDPSSPSYANDTSEARAARLKGYGNAIVPPLAAMFIKSYTEVAHP